MTSHTNGCLCRVVFEYVFVGYVNDVCKNGQLTGLVVAALIVTLVTCFLCFAAPGPKSRLRVCVIVLVVVVVVVIGVALRVLLRNQTKQQRQVSNVYVTETFSTMRSSIR